MLTPCNLLESKRGEEVVDWQIFFKNSNPLEKGESYDTPIKMS